MAHFYPYFLEHNGTGVKPVFGAGGIENLIKATEVRSTNLGTQMPPGHWAIGVNTSPGYTTAADLTVGGTFALGLMEPDDFAVDIDKLKYTPTAYIVGKTLIRGANLPAPEEVPNPPPLRIDSGSVTDPALGVRGTSNFQGNVALAGHWQVDGSARTVGPSRLSLTNAAPAAEPGYTLDVDGKIRLTQSIVVLQGTVQVPNPPNAGNIAALWQIRGNGVKFHDNSPLKNDDPLVTVNEFGEVTIHKALTVVGAVKAATVEASETLKGKIVEATEKVKGKIVEATEKVKGKIVEATETVKGKIVEATETVKAKTVDAENIIASVNLNAFNLTVLHDLTVNHNVTVKNDLTVKNKINAKNITAKNKIKAKTVIADGIFAKRAKIGPRGIIRPPPHPTLESGSYAALKVVGGFIGQTMTDNFIGSGKYIVMGQSPPIGIHGGRYGVTIRNGKHFCSLRVIKAGDTILSWGHADRVRFRYEGHRWSHKKHKFVHASRDIVSIERRGRVLVYGGITASAYGKNCDERFKEAITPLDGALDKVLAMRGVSYLYREDMFDAPSDPASSDDDGEFDDGEQPEHVDFSATMTPERRPQLGIIAQEVEKVCPEMISTDDEGYKTLDISQLNPLLLEAIKEQQGIIEAQNTRIAALERAILAKNE